VAADIVMNVGEALIGEGNEIAHIDLLIGKKEGPVGLAFANALANQSAGHTNLLAVLTPNLIAKPATILITKVTIKGMKQAVQMFGPA
jgi:5,6,7,8-tetrahydromethanopterin hydro-lyase